MCIVKSITKLHIKRYVQTYNTHSINHFYVKVNIKNLKKIILRFNIYLNLILHQEEKKKELNFLTSNLFPAYVQRLSSTLCFRSIFNGEPQGVFSMKISLPVPSRNCQWYSTNVARYMALRS